MLWAIGIIALSIPLAVSIIESAVDSISPIVPDSLEAPPIQLGRLRPGERRIVNCTIRNRAGRVLRLANPRVTCGCVKVAQGALSLRPGESRSIEFTYVAPERLQPVDEAIILNALDAPNEVSWKIAIQGHVHANAWAEPGRVLINASDTESPHAILRIHHLSPVTIDAVRSDSADLAITTVSDANHVLVLRLSLLGSREQRRKVGSATVDVSTSDDQDGRFLQIPVKWHPSRKVYSIPAEILVNGYGSSPEPFSRKVVLTGITAIEASRIAVSAIESWVRVDKQRHNGALVELQLVFDPALMPNSFDVGILKVCIDADTCEIIQAHGKR